MLCRPSDHLGLAIFFKTDKFSLISEDSFLIHERVECLQRISPLEDGIVSSLSTYMKDTSTYPTAGPPGCLMVNLQCKQTGSILTVANVHITWKKRKYPVLQILQVGL